MANTIDNSPLLHLHVLVKNVMSNTFDYNKYHIRIVPSGLLIN